MKDRLTPIVIIVGVIAVAYIVGVALGSAIWFLLAQ